MIGNRQKRFLAAAFIANNGGEFDWNAAAKIMGTDEDDAEDLTMALADVGYFEAIGYDSTTALFTPAGRIAARDAIDAGFGEGMKK